MEMVNLVGAHKPQTFRNNTDQSKLVIWDNSTSLPEDIVPIEIKETFTSIQTYIEKFLTSEHPFRKGSVCPFVKMALKNNQIFYTYMLNYEINENLNFILSCINEFKKRKRDGTFGAICILLPKNFKVHNLLNIQKAAKVKCIENEIMIGAIYKTNQSPSIHNSSYFPLRTETPILVLRDIHFHDLIFLDPNHYGIKKRMAFLGSYIKKFDKLNALKAKSNISKAKRIYLKYKTILYARYYATVFSLIIIFLYIGRYIYDF